MDVAHLSGVWKQRSRLSPSRSSVVHTLLRLTCGEHGNNSLSSAAVSPAGHRTRRKPGAGDCQPCSGCSGETRLSAVFGSKSGVCWLPGSFNQRSAQVMNTEAAQTAAATEAVNREGKCFVCLFVCSVVSSKFFFQFFFLLFFWNHVNKHFFFFPFLVFCSVLHWVYFHFLCGIVWEEMLKF